MLPLLIWFHWKRSPPWNENLDFFSWFDFAALFYWKNYAYILQFAHAIYCAWYSTSIRNTITLILFWKSSWGCRHYWSIFYSQSIQGGFNTNILPMFIPFAFSQSPFNQVLLQFVSSCCNVLKCSTWIIAYIFTSIVTVLPEDFGICHG
jgi:hypothetical protein